MDNSLFPPKLKPGDSVRVIAPSRSLAIIQQAHRALAQERLESLGLNVSFGEHVKESDEFLSSSVESRVEDLHSAFSDPTVKGILTAIGGFNSNQLLKYLDYNLIRSNPKVFCGYSDITAVQNAIYCKTGLVTYSGPHFSTFAMKQRIDFTLEHFKKCFFSEEPFDCAPSSFWSDDPWYLDQENRTFVPNDGLKVIQTGVAQGSILGGNLCTLNLLHGTEYMPPLRDSILFLEDDELPGSFSDVEFDRNLQAILHLPGFSGVRGMVIGRFQKRSEMTVAKIKTIIHSKRELRNVPVIYGADFGHTDPYLTFPIGGEAILTANSDHTATVRIVKH
jgi:muramoyltetrapeptide carboxypeptidase